MKLARKTNYALKLLVFLAGKPGQVIPASEISKRQNIPHKFLEQILGVLRRQGLVLSERGNRGGYSLARDAAEISLFDVIYLFEKGLMATTVNKALDTSPIALALNEVWFDLEKHTLQRLKAISLKTISERENELSASSALNFVI
jgi:Rrf2 family protein